MPNKVELLVTISPLINAASTLPLLLYEQLTKVSAVYAKDLQAFPGEICKLLDNNAQRMNPDLRKNLVKALILLRNRNFISPMEYVQNLLIWI